MTPKFKVWCIAVNEWEEHKIFVDGDGILWHDASLHPIQLSPKNHTVVWCTGAKDMNNEYIYSGDIVRKEECSPDDPAYGSYGSIGVVIYDKYVMGFIVDTTETCDGGFYGTAGVDFSFRELEVIGNIYENHDMLE